MARNSLKNVLRLIDANTKQVLPPAEQFLGDLKRSIELSEEKCQRKPTQTYKPSSMNCLRSMWFQVTGAEPDLQQASYILTGIVNSGSDIHIRIQTAVSKMRENGMDCDYIDVAQFVRNRNLDHLEIRDTVSKMETKLHHKILNMNFMCDGIIKYKNHYYILELKTETSYKWQNRQGVDPDHYNQAIAYALSFDLDEVLFVYINRDMLDMKAYLFTVTDEMKQQLVGRIEECDGYVKRFTCPPKPVDVSKKTCEYCDYKMMCRKQG